MAITVNPAAFFDVTIGVTLIGLAVTGSLFGVSTAQACWYYKHYPRDREFLKTLVGIIWAFDVFHLLLYGATMWTYLVRKEVQALGPTTLPWESSAQLLCNACAIVIIQSFYTYRIWTLSKNRTLAALLVCNLIICIAPLVQHPCQYTIVFGDFGLAFTLFLKSIMTVDVEDYIGLTSLDIALSSVTATTDVLLSTTLVILLAMSRTGSVGANRLINKLMLYTINTGSLTSICAICSLIAVIILPTTAIYVMFYYIGTRLYSISLLATLNAREGLRIQAERIGHVSLPRLSSVSCKSPGKRLASVVTPQVPPRDIVVTIQHDANSAFEEDHGVKEMYRRARPGARHGRDGSSDVEIGEGHLLEAEESSASSLREWEPVKLESCQVLPEYRR
ncbi:hypothetical protein C8Q73DRAFT_778030 [Cubamyces lactineus]|nr:hypothetical protein C8Q73DRAFT_778030 [Cubamyces lactineus]